MNTVSKRSFGVGVGVIAVACVVAGFLSFHNSMSAHPEGVYVKAASERVVKPDPLEYAGPWSNGAVYTLFDLTSCSVGDALTSVKNVSAKTVEINDISADIFGDQYPSREYATYEVVRLKQGSTTGLITRNFNLSDLGNIESVAAATGARLPPSAANDSWYALVALLKVERNHQFAWGIRGLNVDYQVGGKKFSTQFHQSVGLPSTTDCG